MKRVSKRGKAGGGEESGGGRERVGVEYMITNSHFVDLFVDLFVD